MHASAKRTIRLGITVGLSLGAIVGLVGCSEMADDSEGSSNHAVESENGLLGVNGIPGINGMPGVNGLYGTNGISAVNGISGTNGLTGVNGIGGVNGLSAVNGIGGVNGLAEMSGLMTTDAGRKTVAYLVRCALSSGDTLVKKDQNGTQYTFNGGLGLCPDWKWNGIATSSYRTCQNMVSACMMAHINTSGVHVPLWIDSESSKVGWGVSPNYPKQEGTFFGNILMTGSLTNLGMPQVNAPAAYFCEGAGITAGVVSGRIGSGQANAPYVNPYGANVKCSNGQTVAGPTSAGMNAPDGYKQACANNYCFQNGEPLTVWRNPTYTPVFDQAYRYSLIPTSSTTRAMDVAGDGVTVMQSDIPSTGLDDDSKFAILSSGSNWKVVLKKNTNKCVGPDGKGTGNGTPMKVQDCDGSTAQAFTITADANNGSFQMKNLASGRCLDVAWGNDPNQNKNGNLFQLYDCWNGPNQRFNMKPSY